MISTRCETRPRASGWPQFRASPRHRTGWQAQRAGPCLRRANALAKGEVPRAAADANSLEVAEGCSRISLTACERKARDPSSGFHIAGFAARSAKSAPHRASRDETNSVLVSRHHLP
jgi:hypothetical protein